MSNPFADGGALATILAALYAVIYQPWSKEAKERRREKKIVDMFMTGDPGTKGLIEKILPAPERVEILEQACAEYEQTLADHEKRIGDDHTLLLAVKDGIDGLNKEFADYRKLNDRNGGDGPGMGDTLLRIAQKLGVDIAPEAT